MDTNHFTNIFLSERLHLVFALILHCAMEVAITAETYGVCPRCPKCKEEVLGGNFGKLNDQFYHAGCLKCKECGNFADCDTAKFRHDDVFCLPCYAKLYWFRCSVCSKPMNPRETLQVSLFTTLHLPN